jgi:hypothetical protein
MSRRLRWPSTVLTLLALAGAVIQSTMLPEPLVAAADSSRTVAVQPVVG